MICIDRNNASSTPVNCMDMIKSSHIFSPVILMPLNLSPIKTSLSPHEIKTLAASNSSLLYPTADVGTLISLPT